MTIEEHWQRFEERESYRAWLEWRFERDGLMEDMNEDDYPERDDCDD